MDLVDLMDSEYRAAKRRWLWVLLLDFALLLFSVGAVFLTAARWATPLAVCSLLAPLIGFWCKQRADDHYRTASEIRGTLLLRDGLGRQPSDLQLAKLQAEIGAAAKRIEHDGKPYFSSTLKPGAQRLAMHIEESAFYTESHSKRLSRWCWAIVAVGGGAIVLLLWVFVQRGAPLLGMTAEMVARAFSVFALFILTGTFANLGCSFSTLAKVASATVEKCDALRINAAATEAEVMLALDGYDSALATAPPIPEFLHRSRRKQLGDAWEKHISKTLAA